MPVSADVQLHPSLSSRSTALLVLMWVWSPPSCHILQCSIVSHTAVQMHSMLAFEFAGGWSDFKGSIAVTVLQFLLGGGGSFSSGGPGVIFPAASVIQPPQPPQISLSSLLCCR